MPDEFGAAGARSWTRGAGVGGHSDDQVHVALAELFGQEPSRLPRFAGGILETASRKALGYRYAKDAGANHDQQCYRDYSRRCRDGKSRDTM